MIFCARLSVNGDARAEEMYIVLLLINVMMVMVTMIRKRNEIAACDPQGWRKEGHQ